MCRSLRCHRRKQIVCPLLIEMHYFSDLSLWIVLFLQFLRNVASVLRVLPRHVAHQHRLLLLEVLAFRPLGLELPPGRCRCYLHLQLPLGRSLWRPSRRKEH